MASGRKGYILIVEDDEPIREMLRMTLEFEDYRVQTAGDGREALSFLKSAERPALILLDLLMPVMDGWTFAARLADDARLASVPIVVVSAYAEKAGSVSNAVGVVKKPVNFNVLMEYVRKYCEGSEPAHVLSA